MKKIIFLLLISIQSFSQGFLTAPSNLTNQIPSIIVPNGTAWASVNFSDYGLTSVNVNTNNVISSCSITWAQGNYNGSINGTYTIYGYASCLSTPIVSMIINVVTLDTDYQALLTKATGLGYTLPTPIIQGAGNQYILDQKANGTWSTKDVLYVLMTDGDANFATLNWKNPNSNQLVSHGTVTFTSKKGYAGNGITGYLDTGYNPSTATNYTLNDAGVAAYAYDNTSIQIGCVATGARTTIVTSTTASTAPASRVSFVEVNGSGGPGNLPSSYTGGFYHAYRTASTGINMAKNGGNIFTAIVDASIARPNANVYIGARNNNGTTDSFLPGIVSMFWAGGSCAGSTTQIINEHLAWQKYLLTIRAKPTFAAPAAIGTIINDAFNRASLGNSYTVIGSATWACNGSVLQESGGATSTYTNRLVYNYGQSSENVTINTTKTLKSVPSGTTGGTYFVFSDFGGVNGERSIILKLDCTTGTDAGKVTINTWDGATLVQKAIGNAIPTLANGNAFNFVVTKSIVSGLVSYTITVTRVSDSASSTCTYATIVGDSTGDFGMGTNGGNFDTSLFKVTINDEKNHLLCYIGDSLTHGFAATVLTNRFANLIYPSDFQVSAGSGDLTNDVFGTTLTTVAGKMQNLIDYNAKYYVLIIGGNDVGVGFNAQSQACLIAIANTFINEGYKIFFCTPPPRSVDLGVLTPFTKNNFPSYLTTDAGWVATKNGGSSSLNPTYDIGDGIHMNDAGMAAYASAIISNLPTFFY